MLEYGPSLLEEFGFSNSINPDADSAPTDDSYLKINSEVIAVREDFDDDLIL